MSESGPVSKVPPVLRCGPFEIDLAESEVRRHGIRLKLQEKPFQLLIKLVERPGAIITREELREKLWSGDTYVDFERSLNVAMSKLRVALGETPDNPRFVETVRGRGYRFIAQITVCDTSASPLPKPGTANGAGHRDERPKRLSRPLILSGVCFGVASVLVGLYLIIRPFPSPRVLEYVQLTKDGHPKNGPLMVDRSDIYFLERRSGQNQLVRMPNTGGLAAPIRSFTAGEALALSPVRSELLMLAPNIRESSLFVVPLPSGAAQQVGSMKAHVAAWSPDGNQVLYANGNDIFIERLDGSANHRIAQVPSRPMQLRWSPDGRKIRAQLFDESIWECSPDGSGQHRLDGMAAWSHSSLGGWTPDGRLFFYARSENNRSDLWAISEPNGKPVRLTSGQISFTSPVSAPDGKKLFAIGTLERNEFVKYDSNAKVFSPLLPGISAEGLAFSPDRQWIAYTMSPNKTLWRSRADGSERLQLTFPPAETLTPVWSPDGENIVFISRLRGGHWNIMTIPRSGGIASPLMPGDQDQANPSWSPDGRTLAFAGAPWVQAFAPHSTAIHLLDVASRKIITLPDSDGLWSPRWSPNGKYIVAETLDARGLMLFDVPSRRWIKIASLGDPAIGYTAWSSDSRFVYYNAYTSGADEIHRVNVSTLAAERVIVIDNLDEPEPLGRWFTLSPDNSPLLLRDTSIREIYALTLQY